MHGEARDCALGERDARSRRGARCCPSSVSAISGSMTFSWKLPEAPAMPTAASLAETRVAAIATASGITGLTLPGMMLEPGCSAGSEISASPASGPEFIQRRSFEILSSATAQARSAPDSSTAVSCDARPRNGRARRRSARPVRAASRAMARFANSGCALTPVPTAVPPSASRTSRGTTLLRCAPRRPRPASARRAFPGRS